MKSFKSQWIVIPTCLMLAAGIVAFADDKPQNKSNKNQAAELLKKLSQEKSSSNLFGWQVRKDGTNSATDFFFSPQSAGKYWIGVQCSPANDDLRSQLGLEKGIGLVVQSVSSDSPASKGKLQKHDILLKFGKNNLKTIGQLTKAIQNSAGKNVKIVIVRKGKKQTVSVKPLERKGFRNEFQFSGKGSNEAQKQFQKFFKGGNFKFDDNQFELKFDKKQMEALQKRFQSKDFKNDFDLKFFGPGVIMPFGKNGEFKPGNSTFMFKKDGDGKANIRIQIDGKTWDATEGNLDKLPKDIRKKVEAALKNIKSGNGNRFQFQFGGKNFPNAQIKNFGGPGFLTKKMAIMKSKTNGGKSKIKVIKDGKSWEVGEDELDKLPKDIREKVKQALKNKGNFSSKKFDGNFFHRQQRSDSKSGDFQKKVDDLNRQVEELQKALEKLKKNKRRNPVSEDIV